MRKRAVISSFATLDYVMTTDASPLDARTTPVRIVHGAWPRPGGAAFYAARQLAAHGHIAHPLVGIGTDASGDIFRNACLSAGIAIDGLAVQPGGRSAICMLVYRQGGDYSCLLDAGTAPAAALSVDQAALVDAADLVVVAAASEATTRAIIDRVTPAQTVAWIVKDDTVCFPGPLRRDLAARADIIFCNGAERILIGRAGEHQWVIETRGAEGAVVAHGGTVTHVAVDRVETADATGAGDTLAGSVLGQFLAGEADIATAVARAAQRVRDMLLMRGATDRGI